MNLNPGKIPHETLKRILSQITSDELDNRVVVGPKVGQDVAVIDIGERYLVCKTDPITFSTKEIGYYVVNINANDIATAGAKPMWFQVTLLLPQETATEAMCKEIIGEIDDECRRHNISFIGGHTETTFGLNRPIAVGCMMGEVEKDKLVTTMGGKPGDALFLTKGIVIEGSAIIAQEKEKQLLEKGVSQEIIDLGKKYLHDPGISIVKDALLVNDNFEIHAMHDPTEGGLANGVVELVRNSGCGMLIKKEKIPILKGSLELCESFDLNPLQTITSGCLVFAAPKNQSDDICEFMADHGIKTAEIGILTEKQGDYRIQYENGKIEELEYSDTDEITKIF